MSGFSVPEQGDQDADVAGRERDRPVTADERLVGVPEPAGPVPAGEGGEPVAVAAGGERDVGKLVEVRPAVPLA